MRTFTVGIDDRMDETLERLKQAFHRSSKADVFRMGIALLSIADEALREGKKLTVSDKDQVIKEILIPR